MNEYAGGDSGTIIHTADGGITWNHQETGTTHAVKGISFVDKYYGYAIAYGGVDESYEGIVLKTTNGGASFVSPTSGPSMSALNVYPVPVKRSFFLSIDTRERTGIKVYLINPDGEIAKFLGDQEISPGAPAIEIPRPDIPGGLYILQVKTRGETLYRKILLDPR